jgi:NAD(P)-dependent dehydrogenase (short-subunit alcohol dehydrogenase family)
VVIAARRETESLDVLAEVKALGVEGLYVSTDITKLADIKTMVKETITKFGRLDFAFNNAGLEELPSDLATKTEAFYHQVMDINVKGVLFSMQEEVTAMLKNGGGVIINNASIAGLIGIGKIPIYVASKHAVLGLTKSVAIEFAGQNIRVNAVAPGPVETAMFRKYVEGNDQVDEYINQAIPIGRVGTPEEIASAVLWLCHPGAAFTIGQTITIDGGFTAQ